VRAARELLGEAMPMVATYDFHSTMSQWENENIVPFPNDTNPHLDGYERGLEAAGCLLKMLDGSLNPVTRRLLIPIIGPNIGQSTWSQIPEQEQTLLFYQLNETRAELEKTPGVVNITIIGGYGYGDSPDAGMSIVTTTDGDEALAHRLCAELGQSLWDQRERLLDVRPILRVDDGVREAMSREQAPVMLVDLGDDPGSACPADSPAVLESLIRLGAADCALTIRDAEVVEAGLQAGIGATLSMKVGGKIDRRFYEPLEITGTVRLIDDGNYMILGPTHGGWGRDVNTDAFRESHAGPRIVLRIGNKIDVIFSKRRTGKDRDFFKSAGIILEEKQILVVKSNQAHRASFDQVVASTIELASPGVSTVDYGSLPYEYLQRPIWPIDPDMTWSAT
jgi:microcystin degradation protein MlrC